jgi:hypothetical protein
VTRRFDEILKKEKPEVVAKAWAKADAILLDIPLMETGIKALRPKKEREEKDRQ